MVGMCRQPIEKRVIVLQNWRQKYWRCREHGFGIITKMVCKHSKETEQESNRNCPRNFKRNYHTVIIFVRCRAKLSYTQPQFSFIIRRRSTTYSARNTNRFTIGGCIVYLGRAKHRIAPTRQRKTDPIIGTIARYWQLCFGC